ncbi:MAG TPA: single-stranded DNA-binding protein [Mycobacteriales bacterium]|nr:single-stranded DNA-binding protein [Mycobacteriales bacterium]
MARVKDAAPEWPDRNDITLVGRLSAAPEERVLPSGDELVTWRLVVRRPPATRTTSSRAGSVDTIDCSSFRADVRRQAGRWSPDDVLEVNGALRRRFWRSGGGAASRTEVEVVSARRVRAAS